MYLHLCCFRSCCACNALYCNREDCRTQFARIHGNIISFYTQWVVN